MPDWILTEEFRTAAVLISLALLCVMAAVGLGVIAKHARRAALSASRLHLQQATIIGMLLRAGFRPPTQKVDWFEDSHKTQVKDAGYPHDTQWDMRQPWVD